MSLFMPGLFPTSPVSESGAGRHDLNSDVAGIIVNAKHTKRLRKIRFSKDLKAQWDYLVTCVVLVIYFWDMSALLLAVRFATIVMVIQLESKLDDLLILNRDTLLLTQEEIEARESLTTLAERMKSVYLNQSKLLVFLMGVASICLHVLNDMAQTGSPEDWHHGWIFVDLIGESAKKPLYLLIIGDLIVLLGLLILIDCRGGQDMGLEPETQYPTDEELSQDLEDGMSGSLTVQEFKLMPSLLTDDVLSIWKRLSKMAASVSKYDETMRNGHTLNEGMYSYGTV